MIRAVLYGVVTALLTGMPVVGFVAAIAAEDDTRVPRSVFVGIALFAGALGLLAGIQTWPWPEQVAR